MALVIPPEHAEALVSLAGLDNDTFEKLRTALNEEPSTAEPSKVAERLTSRIKDSSLPNYVELIESVMQTLNTKRKMALSDDEIVGEILNGISDNREEPLSVEERGAVSDRLKCLIEPGSPLVRSLKAQEVLASHQCVFRDARIMTDVRPVFEDDLDIPFQDFVTVHTLQITCWEDGAIKQISVALDVADLKNLKSVIERATRKNEAVESRLSGLGLRVAMPEHS